MQIRAFIAGTITPTPSLRSVIETLDRMGRAVRPVRADHLHVTLKFLGDVAAERVPEIARVMQSTVATHEPFEVRVVGLGAFPRRERPSVVWAGMEDARPLVDLAEELELALDDLGYPPEARAFHPHLTLARIKSRPPEELDELFDRHEKEEFARQLVEEVRLYQSELGRDGAVHTIVAAADLGG